MKKQVLSIMALLAMSFSLKAQTTGGPDAYGYIWRNELDASGPVYNWVEIDGLPNTVEVIDLSDDDVSGQIIALPNPFHYYWYDVSNVYIGSNGYLTFNSNTAIASGMKACGRKQAHAICHSAPRPWRTPRDDQPLT